MEAAVIILAAGEGTRMRSATPKLLHEVAGAPLVVHAMDTALKFKAARTVLVTGSGAAAVEAAARAHDPRAEFVHQDPRQGTGHAVAQARDLLSDFPGDVLVLYGDTPFIRLETLNKMREARGAGNAVVVLGFRARDPAGSGRLIARGGALQAIVEAKDATPAELAIDLCNSGVVCAGRETLFSLIDEVKNDNAKGEYYLTDIVGIARERGLNCAAVECREEETLGVNSRVDLAAAERVFQSRARASAMTAGVTMQDPETVYMSYDTELGRDVVIEPNVRFGRGVIVEDGATIRAFSHLEGCRIGRGVQVGPFARLRPGADIDDGARIGNFVEVKASHVAHGAKVNHLSYIGDTEVGAAANIGAGTITCNYDGVFKHRTEIGARAFIGSNSALVAPVRIGDDALVGSGSVITSDVPEGALALGRGRQETKPKLGKRLMDRLRALKARNSGK
ncbi:MAG: bifunctional UDP-N-acetylglucosamine diphosphorylase/glucosamine-1-phosphate N-acetyltransferase GlmU [Paracoccaceae bacterium]